MNIAEREKFFHIDWGLFLLILTACVSGVFIVYSASGGNMEVVFKHSLRIGFGLVAMLVVAQFSPVFLKRHATKLYLLAVLLLFTVLVIGVVGKGAQRWLDLGFMRIQPSELMKLAMPLMVAWWLNKYPLPVRYSQLFVSLLIVVIPTALIILQPDLGTALLISSSGLIVIFLAGISWRLILTALGVFAAVVPIFYYFVLHDYQRSRILTLFNPWQDPLGAGYHTIQSMIAIGSGGIGGKGWVGGTQSQLDFLPERHTDFIFSVFAEEFGFIGFLILMTIYLAIVFRGIYIALHTRSVFARLLSGSITLTFFFYVFVNIGMVAGILPVVGVPLPLVSYGGTSMVTLLIGFGMLMAVKSHRDIAAH